MVRSYLGFVTLALAGTGLAPLVTIFASSYLQHGVFPWSKVPMYLLIALVVCGLAMLLHLLLLRLTVGFEGAASDQAVFLRSELPERWVGLAILASAALSLFLELAIIRWRQPCFPSLRSIRTCLCCRASPVSDWVTPWDA